MGALSCYLGHDLPAGRISVVIWPYAGTIRGPLIGAPSHETGAHYETLDCYLF